MGAAAALGSIIPAIFSFAGGRMRDAAAARQNRRARSQDARHAEQMAPFIENIQGFDTSPLRDFDTSALMDFANQLYGEGNRGPSVDRIGGGVGGRIDTSRLENLPTDLDLSRLRESDTTGLEAAAGRQFRDQAGQLDAQLAGRGIFNTGSGAIQQRQLQADMMSNLASQINQDQFAREQAALDFERGGQQLEAQNLAQALGLGVQQRGQDVNVRGQDVSQRNADLQDAMGRMGMAGDYISQALGMDLGALESALGMDLQSQQAAAQLFANQPGFADYNISEGQFQEGVTPWELPQPEQATSSDVRNDFMQSRAGGPSGFQNGGGMSSFMAAMQGGSPFTGGGPFTGATRRRNAFMR